MRTDGRSRARSPSAGGAGLKPFVDRVHKMGLKVGLHTLFVTRAALSERSLGKGPQGHRQRHRRPRVQLAALGVRCQRVAAWRASLPRQYLRTVRRVGSGPDQERLHVWRQLGREGAVRAAIDKAGRDVVYSLSPGGATPGGSPRQGAQLICTASRVTGTTASRPRRRIADPHRALRGSTSLPERHRKPGFPDLTSFRRTRGRPTRRSILSLSDDAGAIVRSPLFIGADLSRDGLAASDLCLTNEAVLAVSIPATGRSGGRGIRGRGLAADADADAAAADMYVALLNNGTATRIVSATFAELGLPPRATCRVYDVWEAHREARPRPHRAGAAGRARQCAAACLQL